MMTKNKIFMQRLLSITLALSMLFTLQLPTMTFDAFAEDNYMLTPNDSSVIDTAVTNKAVFYDLSTYLFYRVPVNLKVTYLKTSFEQGCSATANSSGYVYIITPDSGDFSQVKSLIQDGYTEISSNFAPDFYKVSGAVDNVQLRIFGKFVMAGAKIEFSKWVIPFFSKTEINFNDSLSPLNGATVGKVSLGTKIWSDQSYTFKNYPSCLEGASFVNSVMNGTSSSASAVKQGYVYVITPAEGQTGSLASTLKSALFEKIDIPSFELYDGITVPVEVYGKVCLPGDSYNYTGWGVIIFSDEQINFTNNVYQNEDLAVLEPSSSETVGIAELGETIYTDRTSVFNVIPAFLQGKHFIQGSIDGGYTVTVKKEGYVYAMTPNIGQGCTQAQNLMNAGFDKLDYVYIVRLYLQHGEKTGVYRKYCTAGETFSFEKYVLYFFDNETGVDNLATVESSGFNQVTELKPEARIFRDRHFFVYQTLPDAFNGKSFLMGSIDGGSATIKTSGNILILTPDASTTNSQESSLLSAGFTKLSYPPFALANELTENATVFTKYVSAGETITYGKWAVLVGAALPQEEYYVFSSDTAADVITNPGDDYAEDGSFRGTYQGCPSIESTPGGRLWATWFTGGVSEPSKGNYGTVSYSDDDGQTWVDHAIIVQHSDCDNVRVEDTQLWTDPQGDLWLFWCQSYCLQDASALGVWANFDMSLGVWAVKISNPDASIDEIAWTQPIKIGNGLMRNKLTVLNEGQENEEWLLSTYDCIDNNYSNVYSSIDKGISWQLKGRAYSKSDNIFDEHQIVEREDGSLWMFLRTKIDGLGVISESFSYDGGKSWSSAQNTGIGSANSRFYFSSLASGNILLVRNNSTGSRNNLTAFLSTNDGLSFDYSLLLDERNDVSYPDVEEMPDGTIYVTYDRGRTSTREILWAGFTEQDIIDGTYNSEGSFSKTIISKMYNYPILNENGYIYTGSDVEVPVTLQDGTFISVDGNNIALEDYSFADGVLTVSKDYIDTLPQGESSFDLVTDIKVLSFRIIKTLVDQENYYTGFEEGSLSDFSEKADATATGQVFDLVSDGDKTVVKASAQGTTGWPIHSLYLSNLLYENVTVESTFKRDTSVSGFPLIFLHRSNGNANQEQSGGGVAVGIQGNGKLTVYSDGGVVIQHEIPSGIYTDGQYNTLKIVAQGNKYQIYLNSTYLETYVDSENHDKTIGYVGIAVSNSVTYFDDFKVTLGSEESVSSADSTLEYRFDSADEISAFDAYYSSASNSTGVKGNIGDQWTYQDGSITRTGTISDGSMDNIASLILKDYIFKNYELSVDFKRGTSSWSWATLISKQRNAGNGMTTSGFALFMQREGKPTIWGESGITSSAYAPVTISDYDDTAWHNMKLKVVNRDIWIYIDGEQYIYVNTLGTYFLLSGLLGMQSVDNDCSFDNFAVTRLDDSGNPQSVAFDEEKTNVLCVGDSITYGEGASSTAATYPAQLQQMLGSEYNVVNYGVSGRTVLKKSNAPIWNDIEYTYSLKQVPDIVVIMLGTNDAKSTNWVYKDEFVADYTALINSYKALSPDIKVYVMTSPTLYRAEDGLLCDSVVTGEVVPLQKQIAQDTGSAIIDLNADTKNMEEHFPDQIHPDDYGYSMIASVTASSINNTQIDAVILKISDIGTITPASGSIIETASAGYDLLDSNLKALVTNYSTLTDAVTEYNTFRPTIVGSTIKTDNTNDLRFHTTVPTATIPDGYSVVSYGTLMIPTQLLTGNLTADTISVADASATGSCPSLDWYAVLNQSSNHAGVRVSARSYVIYQDADSNTYTIYSDNEDSSKTIANGTANKSVNGIARSIANAIITSKDAIATAGVPIEYTDYVIRDTVPSNVYGNAATVSAENVRGFVTRNALAISWLTANN